MGPVGWPEASVTYLPLQRRVTSGKSEDLTLKQSRKVTTFELSSILLELEVYCLNQLMGFLDRVWYAVAATCVLFSHPEDGGSTFLRKFGIYLLSSTV
jgi:hypothetical protein